MRLDEDFKSTHNLTTWALANELGDGAVCDRGIIEELSALLQPQCPTMELCTAAIYLKTASGMRCFGSIEAKKA